uniref:Uncharacterized protein n=1 Tax=Oncorhynchus tshawytscha TaxID=74940 RepID=A0AAZ3NQP3_ONCTS
MYKKYPQMKAHRLHFNLIVIVSNSNFWSIEPKEDFAVPIFTVSSVHKWVKLKLTVGSRPAAGLWRCDTQSFPFFLSSGRLYKQSKVYLPEPPFPHSELIQTNKLKHYPSIHGDFSSEFRQPCVVFNGHPSLRFGDVVHFMELWGKSSLNTIISTEPDFLDASYLNAVAPYQPLAMKCVYCPIDTRLNFHQVSKLLTEVQPLHVVYPEQYTQPPPTQSHCSDLMLELQPPPMPYRRCSVLGLPFRRRWERIQLLPELAKSLVPSEIKPGISVATVSAVLQSKDNKHMLQLVPKPPLLPPSKKRKRVVKEPPEVLAPKPLLSGAVPPGNLPSHVT